MEIGTSLIALIISSKYGCYNIIIVAWWTCGSRWVWVCVCVGGRITIIFLCMNLKRTKVIIPCRQIYYVLCMIYIYYSMSDLCIYVTCTTTYTCLVCQIYIIILYLCSRYYMHTACRVCYIIWKTCFLPRHHHHNNYGASLSDICKFSMMAYNQ